MNDADNSKKKRSSGDAEDDTEESLGVRKKMKQRHGKKKMH